jgi:hypothetical protein
MQPPLAMRRDDNEGDRKRPRPVRHPKKRTGAGETAEAVPWTHLRKDNERDRHRHVC